MIKESYKIDNLTTSKVIIKERQRKVKVFLNDCSDDIDWIFLKDENGILKINKVIKAFERVRELLNKDK